MPIKNRITQIRRQMAKLNKDLHDLEATINALDMEITMHLSSSPSPSSPIMPSPLLLHMANSPSGNSPFIPMPKSFSRDPYFSSPFMENMSMPQFSFELNPFHRGMVQTFNVNEEASYTAIVPPNVYHYIQNFRMVTDNAEAYLSRYHIDDQRYGNANGKFVYVIHDNDKIDDRFHSSVMKFLMNMIKAHGGFFLHPIGVIIDILNIHPKSPEILLSGFNNVNQEISRLVTRELITFNNMKIYTQHVNPATDWRPTAKFTDIKKKEELEWVQTGKVTTYSVGTKKEGDCLILCVNGESNNQMIPESLFNWNTQQSEHMFVLLNTTYEKYGERGSFNVIINIPLHRADRPALTHPAIFILPADMQFDHTQIDMLTVISKWHIYDDVYYYDLISVVDCLEKPKVIRTEKYVSLISKLSASGENVETFVRRVEEIDRTIFCIAEDAIKNASRIKNN